MKRSIVLFTCAALLLASCSFAGFGVVRGSGNVVSEERQVSDFTSIELSGTGDLIVTQGDEEALTIEAEDNLMQYLVSDVENGVLQIGFEEGTPRSYLPTEPIIFHLSVINLDSVSLSGSGSLTSESIETETLNLASSGSGNFSIGSLQADSLDLSISGSGRAEIAGVVDSQSISVSGSGTYEAGDLQTNSTNIDISGGGNAVVWAEETLDIDISGSGDIGYYGQPNLSQSVSGSGDIENLGDK